MRINVPFRAYATVAALVLFVAAPAAAQEQLKLDQVGAALAFPLIAGEGDTTTPPEVQAVDGQAVTYITITNVGPTARNLHFSAIAGAGWAVTDFDCPVTASETVLVTLTPQGLGRALLSMECNQATGLPIFISRLLNMRGEQGVLLVTNETEECKDGTCTTNANDLFGDFVIVNTSMGYAWSAGAIPFQGKDPLAPGVADRDYHFDNTEYAMFPATLAANFIAPGVNNSLDRLVTADLFLFTLDGRANIGSTAALDIVFYDDDETPTSAHYSFECSTIVRLTDINPNFDANLLGSDAGHFYATAIDADQFSNVHDNKFGNGNAIRVVGVHGWLFQTTAVFDGFQFSAWGRSLSQGMLPQDLDGNDVPTFDGL